MRINGSGARGSRSAGGDWSFDALDPTTAWTPVARPSLPGKLSQPSEW